MANMIAEKRGLLTAEGAELLAIDALGWLAGDEEALERFMALTGVDPGQLRQAAADPAFLTGVLDYFANDERLVVAYATHAGIPPERLLVARQVLSGEVE